MKFFGFFIFLILSAKFTQSILTTKESEQEVALKSDNSISDINPEVQQRSLKQAKNIPRIRNMRQLMTLISKKDRNLFVEMAQMNNREKLVYLQRNLSIGGFFNQHKNLFMAIGGILGGKLILDRLNQVYEQHKFENMVDERSHDLMESRRLKRQDINNIQEGLLSLEQRVESLSEMTNSKASELQSWADSHYID